MWFKSVEFEYLIANIVGCQELFIKSKQQITVRAVQFAFSIDKLN